MRTTIWHLVVILLLGSFFSGCAKFNADDFIDQDRIKPAQKLPLTLTIDSSFMDKSLNFTYRHEVRRDYLGSTSWGPTATMHRYQVYYQTRLNTDRPDDARYIIKKSFDDILGATPPNGTITIEMTKWRKGSSCLPCMIFALTLAPYLVGVPAQGHFFEVDLLATVKDNEQKVLSQYKRTGKHTSWDAIWGYGDGVRGIERGACAGAVAEAVNLIIEDIGKDAELLNKLTKPQPAVN